MSDIEMKDKVINKYFKYDNLFCDVRSNLIMRGRYFVDKKLINTQERKYFINDSPVSEEEFFEDIKGNKFYFEDHTYMSKGCNVYRKHYRNTLSLHDCVEEYKKTLDDVDLFILGNISDDRFCHSDYEGNWIIPNKEWKM